MKNILLSICFFSCLQLQLEAQHQWDVIEDIECVYKTADSLLNFSTIHVYYQGEPEKITLTWGDSNRVIQAADYKYKTLKNDCCTDTVHYFSIQLNLSDRSVSNLKMLWNHRVAVAEIKMPLYYNNIRIFTRFDVYLEDFIKTEEVDEDKVPILEPVVVHIPNSMRVIYFNE